MKNKILQEQKMMLSLMGYERGRTTFENQQLNEWGVWDAITDFAEETVDYVTGGQGYIPDAFQKGESTTAKYLRGESGYLPGDQTELKKDIKNVVSKVDKVLDTDLINWAKGNEGLIPDFGGVGTTEMVKNGFNSAAEWIASIDWNDVAHVALPIIEIGLWLATPICPVCPFLAAGVGMADAAIYAKEGDYATGGLVAVLSLLPGVGAVVKKIPGVKVLGQKGMKTLANKLTKMSKGQKVPLTNTEKTVVAALKDPAIQRGIKPAITAQAKKNSAKVVANKNLMQKFGPKFGNTMKDLATMGVVGYGGYKGGQAYAESGAAGPKALLKAKGFPTDKESWNQIKQMFGASGSSKDGELLVQAIKAGWEPGSEVPEEFRTETYVNNMTASLDNELSSEEAEALYNELMALNEEKLIREATSTISSGSYETPMAWQSGGQLTQSPREEIMGVELGIDLPSEVDITDGFNDMGMSVCPSCGKCHEGPCDFHEMPDGLNGESFDVTIDMDDPLTLKDFNTPQKTSDVLPDSLLNLFGDINIGGDLEIELDENPKKLKGSRKFRR
tara:strand:- start:1650 stop:3326 length:1677 start_codon:yes stop_codon:yes gene_type:complete